MKLKIFAFAALACLAIGLPSCRTTDAAISYEEAHNYFARNDVADFSPRLIQSSEELSRYFGPAATMGDNGTPTNIDFSKHNVVAIIDAATNRNTEIKVSSIKKQGKAVTVKYRLMPTGEPMSYSMIPFLLLQIDKKHGNNVIFIKE